MTDKACRITQRGLLALALLLGASEIVGAGSVVDVIVPPEAWHDDGNSYFRPFDWAQAARFQQVYSASAFSDLLPQEGGFISGLCFRIDNAAHPVDATITNFQLNLSTTTRSPDGLSSVFDENVGSDDTVLIGPRSMQFGSGPGGGFSFCFGFHNNPFYYNPTNGNLLVDFRIYSGFGGTFPEYVAFLDAFDVLGDSVSSVYGTGFGTTVLPTTGQPSSLGLATDFLIVPIPEPSALALLACGLGLLGLVWRTFGRGKEKPNVAD